MDMEEYNKYLDYFVLWLVPLVCLGFYLARDQLHFKSELGHFRLFVRVQF